MNFALMTAALLAASAQASQLTHGLDAVRAMTGCYLVDFSYTETESLKPGYTRDARVYDVNKSQSVKEWIYAEEVSPSRIRLQHVLFATSLKGELFEGSELKHTGEDWEYNAPGHPGVAYDFVSPNHWTSRTAPTDTWSRSVVNLDDGLRYSCDGQWKLDTAYPEFSCSGYAPIPGRETRDMGRKDYNTLDRDTRVIVYNGSWLERQANIKVIHDVATGDKTPLAKELGKNWYVRLPDSECEPARAFADAQRREFWKLMRQGWDQVLSSRQPFVEVSTPGKPSRYTRMVQLESAYYHQDLSNPAVRAQALDQIVKIIGEFRGN